MPKKKRKYLPYGLTKAEKADPELRKKLKSCIKQVEKHGCPKSTKKNGKYDYKKCMVNPVAICRASIKNKKPKYVGVYFVEGVNVPTSKVVKRFKELDKSRFGYKTKEYKALKKYLKK